MRIDPVVAALRSDRDLQRRAQGAMVAACDDWRGEPTVAEALAELERFGAGAPLEACPELEAMFTAADGAGEFAARLSRRFAAVLVSEPFGHPPLRHGCDAKVATLLLARAGRAQLMLHAREPGHHEFATAGFSSVLRYDAVLAGKARGRIVRRNPSGFAFQSLALVPGVRLALDLASEALQVETIERRLVTLRLHRFAAEPEPTRDYALADGMLLHQSSGDLAGSRCEMMLAVLGRMGRAEAAPTMAAIAAEPGDPSLRWQALRECLALDTAAGFRALLGVARAADDPLCSAAGALRAQLVEAHPQLLALEE